MKRTLVAGLLLGLGCGDPTGPSASISFKPDAGTCSGTAALDLFIDGSKVGSPTLAAGVASEAFVVATGSHVVRAVSQASGAVWPNEQVTVDGPTVYVLPCTADRPLVPFTATIDNRLSAPLIITVGGFTDTIPARTTELLQFVGSGNFSWSPMRVRYSDGTFVPDDNLFGSAKLTQGGTTVIRALDALDQAYFTFDLSNNSGAAVSVGVYSGISVTCLSNLPATAGTYGFGYFQLRSGSEVRVYRGTNCTGASVFWGASTLNTRNADSGFIALTLTTPP